MPTKLKKPKTKLARLTLAVTLTLAALTLRQISAEWQLPSSDLITLSLGVFYESLPFVILGITISACIQTFIPANTIQKILPKTPLARRITISLTGILLPVCECGNIPLARGLIQKGLKPSEAITFLLAAPLINPITIITTYQAFGWQNGILPARIIGGLTIALLTGYIFSLKEKTDTKTVTTKFQESCTTTTQTTKTHTPTPTHQHPHKQNNKLHTLTNTFITETAALAPALLIGSLIAGTIQTVIHRDTLLHLSANPILSALTLMALAFTVSICSSVDSFFALSFSNIFLPGSTTAFLIFGALCDLKMLALMRTTFTTKTITTIITITTLGTLATAWGVNLLV